MTLDGLLAGVRRHSPSTSRRRSSSATAIAFAPRRRATTPDEAGVAADELGFPVVVKVDGVAHKARDAGVVLGIDSRRARPGGRRAARRPRARRPAARAGTRGVRRHDARPGPRRRSSRSGAAASRSSSSTAPSPPPARSTASTALRLVREAGFEQAVDALADALLAVSRLAVDQPSIEEIDVNPLLLHGDDGDRRRRARRPRGEPDRMSGTVDLERRAGAAWITLNRPDKLNALDACAGRGARRRARRRRPRTTPSGSSSCRARGGRSRPATTSPRRPEGRAARRRLASRARARRRAHAAALVAAQADDRPRARLVPRRRARPRDRLRPRRRVRGRAVRRARDPLRLGPRHAAAARS